MKAELYIACCNIWLLKYLIDLKGSFHFDSLVSISRIITMLLDLELI